jgi:aspartate/methionine/tyrosine aminotransferase
VDPDREVLLLVGSQEGTAHLPLAVLNPGDAGLILDPSYPSHQGGLLLADARIERLALEADQGWRPRWDQLSDQGWRPRWDQLSPSVWDELRLMVMGFPHNPTAQVGEQIWLDEAMDRARRHDLVLAHDNPYLDLALDGEAPALLRTAGWRERGIEFFSLSKGWCPCVSSRGWSTSTSLSLSSRGRSRPLPRCRIGRGGLCRFTANGGTAL